MVPLLGCRRSLIFGSFIFCLAPILTYFSLNSSVILVSFTYGFLSGIAFNIIKVGRFLCNNLIIAVIISAFQSP